MLTRRVYYSIVRMNSILHKDILFVYKCLSCMVYMCGHIFHKLWQLINIKCYLYWPYKHGTNTFVVEYNSKILLSITFCLYTNIRNNSKRYTLETLQITKWHTFFYGGIEYIYSHWENNIIFKLLARSLVVKISSGSSM